MTDTNQLYISNLLELNPEEVADMRQFIRFLFSEFDDSIDTKQGAFNSLVILPNAMLLKAAEELVDRWRKSTSLKLLDENPLLADEELLDIAAENYRISRNNGDVSTGQVTIVLNQRIPVTVPKGQQFIANGVTFETATSFSAKTTSAAVVTTTDRLLRQLDTNQYGFTINVQSTEATNNANIAQNTLITPSPTLPYFVKAYAEDTFTGGASPESNTALINKIISGVSQPIACGRSHMAAMLRNQDDFSGVIADSITGLGDTEMLRDQYSVFPMSFGGRADWYVRPTYEIASKTVTKTFTLSKVLGNGTTQWTGTIGRDDAPGFYGPTKVVSSDGKAASVISDTRNMDLSTLGVDELIPDIQEAEHGAFSRFQTATIVVSLSGEDTSTLTVGTSEKDFSVTLAYLPNIAKIQSFVSDRNVINYGGDVLVKAPCPAQVTLGINIQLQDGQEGPSLSSIQNAAAQAVNNRSFVSTLPASVVTDAIQSLLPTGAYVKPIGMLVRLRQPDNTILTYQSTDAITINLPPYVTDRTLSFFCSASDVLASYT